MLGATNTLIWIAEIASVVMTWTSILSLALVLNHYKPIRRAILSSLLAVCVSIPLTLLSFRYVFSELGSRWFNESDGCQGVMYKIPPSIIMTFLFTVLVQVILLSLLKRSFSKIRLFLTVLLANLLVFGVFQVISR